MMNDFISFHEELDLCKKIHKNLCDYHNDYMSEIVTGIMIYEGFKVYRV